MAIGTVTDTGLSVVYEPEEPSAAIVDIVLVHGLQGHPRGTWTKGKVPKSPRQHQSVSESGNSLEEKKAKSGPLSWISKKLKRKSLGFGQGGIDGNRVNQESSQQAAIPSLAASSRNTTNVSIATASGSKVGVFWPADLLPQACPRARVLVFGYDTKITNYGAASTNKNSIYSHAKDLLFALSRETEGCVGPAGKPQQVIFVAHSLGGIVVKEMLSRSSTSTEPQHARIVESTAGVVFLGTPHRGSPEFAAAGDWARTFVNFFGVETNPAMLHALGLKTTDLERAQESFSGLWLKHGFRVKTFQEGLGLTGLSIGALGSKVVPAYSSSLGDHREHAETIQANHREMCRFYGADDPGYRQVSSELRSIYQTMEKHVGPPMRLPASVQPPSITSSVNNHPPSVMGSMPISVNSLDLWGIDKVPFNEAEKALLTSLWYPNMNSRRRMVTTPADGTCDWLFNDPAYIHWIKGHTQQSDHGLLQISGSPGSGKSVLVKEAYSQALQKYAGSGYCIAAYFFHENGGALEKSKEGLLRSLLYQLLPQDREHLSKASKRFLRWSSSILNQVPRADEKEDIFYSVEQLESTLQSFLMKPSRQRSAERTLIFIDALDECSGSERTALSFFLGATGLRAAKSNVNLNILISNRNFPLLKVGKTPRQLDMNQWNRSDIGRYVEQRLALGITAVKSERSQLRDAICNKARGVFLWVVLVVDGIIERWQQGQSLRELLRHLDCLPGKLQQLYENLITTVPQETKLVTLGLFQWAILASRPLQLREWHDLMAFIGTTTAPKSLKECQESDEFTTTYDQLERKVRSLSRGLLEVAVDTEEPENDPRARSVSQFAAAGSFMMNPGETRIIRVIHETVSEYFRSSTGFADLSDLRIARPIISELIMGEIAIMSTCLEYLGVSELDALVHARLKEAKRKTRRFNAMGKNSPPRDELEEGITVEVDDTFNEESYQSPIGPEGIDVACWLAGIGPLNRNDTGNKDEADCAAAVKRLSRHSDYSTRTQELEAYPGLLHYVTDEFFHHAGSCFDVWELDSKHDSKLRQLIKTGMEPIMDRLLDSDFSMRWLALREELHVIYPVDGNQPLTLHQYLLLIDHGFNFILSGKPSVIPTKDATASMPSEGRETLEEYYQQILAIHKSKYGFKGAEREQFLREKLEQQQLQQQEQEQQERQQEQRRQRQRQEQQQQEEREQQQQQQQQSEQTLKILDLQKLEEYFSYDAVSFGRENSKQPAKSHGLRREDSVGSFRSGLRRQGSVGSFRSAASGGSRHSRC
ncbi:hypothetical protein QBC37DRAFT_379273 [Rhypophila decipiens]|uniref:Nephrocystin 3-like N-terminal domain-containing protein n=1 Tax=Rhypophila decipiens TaxID=261697 RepID=A0AAN6XX48_9PEZI|nr:hypothetical protein QBC37DRAFT_379273 [Rhypophila decipiens]